jgi:hypothetical protein
MPKALFNFFSLPIKAFLHNHWHVLHLVVNSRIALVMQVMNAEKPKQVLVFDEIDVGISGGTAEVVGRLLADLLSMYNCYVLPTKLKLLHIRSTFIGQKTTN